MEKIKLSEFTIEKIKNREFEKYIPELYELEKVIENNPWHDNDSVFNHTITVATELNNLFGIVSDKIKKYLDKKIKNYSRKKLLILAAIFHDIAKRGTFKKENGKTICPEHEMVGSNKLQNIIPRFDLSNDEQSRVMKIVRNHGFIHYNSGNIEKLEEFKKENPDIFIEIALLTKADIIGSQLKNNMPEEFEFRIGFVDKIIRSY